MKDEDSSGNEGRALLVGIDEAGYGPLLGPLVVSATVFELPAENLPIDLWGALAAVPVLRPGEKSRDALFVGDSKQLYGSGKSLRRLEDGVLSFASSAGLVPGISLEEFLDFAGAGQEPDLSSRLFYSEGEETLSLSTGASLRADSLERAMTEKNIRFCRFLSRPVFAREFNTTVEQLGNKSELLFHTGASLVTEILQEFPSIPTVHIYYDKQGGRNFYGDLLLQHFQDSGFLVEYETRTSSSYRLTRRERQCVHRFDMKGDMHHLPVGLASMCSKYVRELLMKRFNRFWHQHKPDLRPTAGYYTDAQRFLAETASLRQRLAIRELDLVRCR